MATTGTDEREVLGTILDPVFYADHGYPHEAWRILRATSPVYWYDGPGVGPIWVLTKHADVQHVSKNPQLFSSAAPLVMRAPEGGFLPALERALGPGAVKGAPPRGMFLSMDPPDHGVYRGFVNKSFTPRALLALEPYIQQQAEMIVDERCAQLVDEAIARKEIEFVSEVAAKLPLVVIAQMMGLPKGDWDFFLEVLLRVGQAEPAYQNNQSAGGLTPESFQLLPYFLEQAKDRRANPGDDLISMLVHGQVDGEPISDIDVVLNCLLFIIAGNETTRNSTSDGMLALLEHPDQLERLRADPSLLPSAVEEIVRWVSPVVFFARGCTQDVEIRGQRIKEGERVLMFYPSANRDEDVFADPFRFDVGRDPNPHLGFGGFGEHFCLGANLARLELRVIFEKLLVSRLARVELSGPVRRARNTFLPGITQMPVRLTA